MARGASRPSRSGGGRAKRPAPKGQIKSGKTVQYAVKDAKGNTKYVGTTNNPTRRAAEHQQTGKLTGRDKLVVQTRAIPRKAAESVEAAKIAAHRKATGANPQHNATPDGKYHKA